MPLKVMTLPGRFVGTGYYLVELAVPGSLSPLSMLLDTGLTIPVMLLSSARDRLGLANGAGSTAAIGATGSVSFNNIRLDGAELRSAGDAGGKPMVLGSMEGVVVDDFPQRSIGEEVGVHLDGMLGQGFLERCDLELDAGQGHLRAWPAGKAPAGSQGWTLLPSLRLPGSLHGLLLHVPGAEPIVGIADTGATHTVINGRAARILGLEAAVAKSRADFNNVRGMGLGGTALEMPLVEVCQACLCGASHVSIVPQGVGADGLRSWAFGNAKVQPGESAGPLSKVQIAVGEIAFFEELLSHPQNSIGNFNGAVALIGQDLLAQRPVRLSALAGRISFADAT